MSVQVKIGRWRTLCGAIAEVRKHCHGESFPWQGVVLGLGGEIWDGSWTDEKQFFYGNAYPLDLKEYLGPLEPAPFDLAAFIAGLKPGDYYTANDGTKGTFCGRWAEWLWLHHPDEYSPKAVHVSNTGLGVFPAGPWVEPPKPTRGTLVWKHDGIESCRAEYTPSPEDGFAQRITYTPGKGFELGEVIQQ